MADLDVQQLAARAISDHQAGRLDAARAGYERVLALKPGHPDATHFLGVLTQAGGDVERGIGLMRDSIRLNPSMAVYHQNLGEVLRKLGRFDEAAEVFSQQLALTPGNPDVLFRLGMSAYGAGQTERARQAFSDAGRAPTAGAELLLKIGNALGQVDDLEGALSAATRARDLSPRSPLIHYTRGLALSRLRRHMEAAAAFSTALALRPDFFQASVNVAGELWRLNRFDEAIDQTQKAIASKPDLPEAHYNLSHLLLTTGRFIEAWPEHEWRWKVGVFPSPRFNYTAPQWRGEDIQGKTILVHAEQGAGDTIQFARYVPLVAKRGARVILQCDESLRRLMERLPGVSKVVVRETGEPPAFDVHCPMLSLPLAFATTLETIPGGVPYLNASAESAARFAHLLDGLAPRPRRRIGIAWAGAAIHAGDAYRSCPLETFLPLAEIPGITLVSVQAGKPAEQIDRLRTRMKVIDPMPSVRDYDDTAGLIENLDLVITVDTSVAHVAGAIGKPVWVMVPFTPDWRWMTNRSDSPWYPTMKLFRHSKEHDWEAVIERVSKELERLSSVSTT